MTGYRLSILAERDLKDVGEYSVDRWGVDQALRYLNGLIEAFENVTRNPKMGRSCIGAQSGYRRLEHQRHVVIYRIDDDVIVINRVLHQAMLPELHAVEDSSD